MFSRILNLSKEGSKMVLKAAVWLAVFQLVTLLPVVPLAKLSEQMLVGFFNQDSTKIPIAPYMVVLLFILLLMFLSYKIAYYKEYLNSGNEEYKLRMEIADKLRRLPLSLADAN